MNKYNFDATFSMDAFLKAYNERVGKEHITKNYPYKFNTIPAKNLYRCDGNCIPPN